MKSNPVALLLVLCVFFRCQPAIETNNNEIGVMTSISKMGYLNEFLCSKHSPVTMADWKGKQYGHSVRFRSIRFPAMNDWNG